MPPHDLSEKVNAYGVDILALQEVDFRRDGGSRVLDCLRRGTPLASIESYEFSPSSFDPELRSGVAVATRYPIVSTERFDLPNPRLRVNHGGRTIGTYDKGAICCRIDVHGLLLNVVSLHMFPFHLFRRDAADRRFQHVWRGLREWIAALDGPTVVAGDFNTAAREPVLHGTRRPFRSAVGAQVTHEGFAADDILFSEEFTAGAQAVVVDGFSDHRFCQAELLWGE